MTEPLTPSQTAEAMQKGIGDFGVWMTGKALGARGRAELGLRSRALYHLSRGGALGDVPVEVVIAAETLSPPEVVRAVWTEGRALDATRFSAGLCAEHARSRFADRPGTARAVELVERVVDGAPRAALPN